MTRIPMLCVLVAVAVAATIHNVAYTSEFKVSVPHVPVPHITTPKVHTQVTTPRVIPGGTLKGTSANITGGSITEKSDSKSQALGKAQSLVNANIQQNKDTIQQANDETADAKASFGASIIPSPQSVVRIAPIQSNGGTFQFPPVKGSDAVLGSVTITQGNGSGGNVISGNGMNGIQIGVSSSNGSSRNMGEGNLISGSGGNVISGNGRNGIQIGVSSSNGSSGNLIDGNKIGGLKGGSKGGSKGSTEVVGYRNGGDPVLLKRLPGH
jgi:hypothetical protein